jgi:hypothetical protein
VRPQGGCLKVVQINGHVGGVGYDPARKLLFLAATAPRPSEETGTLIVFSLVTREVLGQHPLPHRPGAAFVDVP